MLTAHIIRSSVFWRLQQKRGINTRRFTILQDFVEVFLEAAIVAIIIPYVGNPNLMMGLGG